MSRIHPLLTIKITILFSPNPIPIWHSLEMGSATWG